MTLYDLLKINVLIKISYQQIYSSSAHIPLIIHPQENSAVLDSCGTTPHDFSHSLLHLEHRQDYLLALTETPASARSSSGLKNEIVRRVFCFEGSDHRGDKEASNRLQAHRVA